MTPEESADDFYTKAVRPNEPSSSTSAQEETPADRFYRLAEKPVGPKTEARVSEAARVPAASAAATATPTGDLASIGVIAPNGLVLDPALVAEFVPLAKSAGLSPAQAQEFVDLYHAAVTAFGGRR